MTWIVGIDEAGYGPNLGPFIMTAVACSVPDAQAGTCLWQQLAAAVRRCGGKRDDRLIIDDSKAVYNGSRGLAGLERGVFSLLPAWPVNLSALVEALCPHDRDELAEEPWYTGATPLPTAAQPDELHRQRDCLRQACQQQSVQGWLVRSVVVCPRRFNAVVSRTDSKGVVLGLSFVELLRWAHEQTGPDPLVLHSDKQGGRNNYDLLIRQALMPSRLHAVEQSMQRSHYEAQCQSRQLQLTFQPRADSAYLCVALASMVSKYLRELFMGEFNRFWQQHVPELAPTAGYPQDAPRFLEAVRAAAERLQIPLEAIWRQR